MAERHTELTPHQTQAIGEAIRMAIATSRSPLWFSFRLRDPGDWAILMDYGTIHTNGDHEVAHGTVAVHLDGRTVQQAHT